VSRVNPGVYPLAAFGILFVGGEKLQFGFQLLQHGLRKAVRQMEGDMLRHLGTLKVRKVTSAVPPGSAILLNGALGFLAGLHNANREIHPAKPAGWSRVGVPGIVL
jgi:hypothetical protein